jgi:hypothetical protein
MPLVAFCASSENYRELQESLRQIYEITRNGGLSASRASSHLERCSTDSAYSRERAGWGSKKLVR